MNRTERLHDEFEDAAFALLMDQVAQSEGARLLEENERLKNDPDAAVPAEIDQACRDTIRQAFDKKEKKSKARSFGRFLNKLAIAAIALIILFVVSYLTIPEVQAKTLNLLIKTSSVSSRLDLINDEMSDDVSGDNPTTLWGYSLPKFSSSFTISDSGETRHEAWIEYIGKNNEKISIRISKYSTFFDSEENESMERIEVNGHEGVTSQNDSTLYTEWYDETQNLYLTLVCDNVDLNYGRLLTDEIVYVNG